MNTITKTNKYERESVPCPQSHPDRLASIAKLFGIEAPSVKSARVLEIGCANGGNLLPAAYTLPQATFVGVDTSPKQVERGQALAKEMGLKNIDLRVTDLLQLNKELGQFDYIIAHGLFSWVSNEVQEKIFEICSNNLTDNGIAYISYNTYPGWHFRGMIRDMMLYHAGQLEDIRMRAQQSRALLDFLAQSVPTQDNAYGLMLRNELAFLSAQPDAYLLQDLMAESNEPLYFHQFTERANRHGLQYLGEAEFSTMLTRNFPQAVDETLRRISNEIVRTEQYMDFVRNRAFRQTLLCKANVEINRNLNSPTVIPFLISSPLRPQNPELVVQSNQPETFTLPNGIGITTPQPLTKAAFQILAENWPQSVRFDELLNQAIARLSTGTVVQDSQVIEAHRQFLANDLLTAYATNAVLFRTEEAPFVTEVSERPKISELARLQSRNQDFITNQLHETIAVDLFAKHLVNLMNGRRDHTQILEELLELVRQGKLVVQKDGKNIGEGPQLRQTLEALMQETMERMGKAAVLIA